MLLTLDLYVKSQKTILVKDISTRREPMCVSKSAISTTERKANRYNAKKLFWSSNKLKGSAQAYVEGKGYQLKNHGRNNRKIVSFKNSHF